MSELFWRPRALLWDCGWKQAKRSWPATESRLVGTSFKRTYMLKEKPRKGEAWKNSLMLELWGSWQDVDGGQGGMIVLDEGASSQGPSKHTMDVTFHSPHFWSHCLAIQRKYAILTNYIRFHIAWFFSPEDVPMFIVMFIGKHWMWF